MTDDGGIRASDSDREHVVEILRDAYSTGRLTMAEFDERTSPRSPPGPGASCGR